jgi:hypothetical protein
MDLILYKANYENGKQLKIPIEYNLLVDKNITINELSMVYFEVVNATPIDTKEFKIAFGVTSFGLDGGYINLSGLYHYRLFVDKNVFNSSVISFEINNSLVNFYQLFLNELGFIRPLIIYNGKPKEYNQIQINSNKISDINFEIIIKYLMFNNYFDEAILYKTSLPTNYSDFKNSFLESLKLLHKKIEPIAKKVSIFKYKPIKKYSVDYEILPYNSNSIIGNDSFDWLFQNLDALQQSKNNQNYDLKLGNKGFSIQELNQEVSDYNFNSYENRLILGYIRLFIIKLNEERKKISQNIIPRTRYAGNFQEYLITKYNEIIDFYINEVILYFNHIQNYFVNILKVNKPLYEFPKDSFSFLSLPHYKSWFDLIILYNNLFSKQIENNSIKSNLEIESFDRLFEIYIFYLIKDVIVLEFNKNYTFFTEKDNKNKLAGKYIFEKDASETNITLYYESLPKEIRLLTTFTTEHRIYNPDYIIEYSKKGYKEFVILDAKYKNYNKLDRYKSDIKELSFKYLHGLGVTEENCKVSGLYVLYVNKEEKFKKVFRKEFDIFNSDNPVLPSMGGISLDPINFDIKHNLILDVIMRHKALFEKRILNVKSLSLH